MKTTKLFLVAIMLLGITVTGCKKDKIKGCTVSSADNFKSNAEEDDGSCVYSGNYVFWVNTLNAGETIEVSCDGTIGELSLNYTGAPACGTNNGGAISMDRSWTGGATKSYPVVLDYYDASGAYVTTIYTTANFQAKSCVNRMVGI